MGVRRRIRAVLNLVSGCIVGLAVCLAVALVGVRLLGLSVFMVLSGSMEPNYRTGSLIYVKPVDPGELAPGDVITFLLDEDTVVTHRIVEVIQEGEGMSFRTKGDANSSEDRGAVAAENVIGEPVLAIPGLGFFVSWMQHPPGSFAAVAVGAALVLFAILPDLLGGEEGRARRSGQRRRSARRGRHSRMAG